MRKVFGAVLAGTMVAFGMLSAANAAPLKEGEFVCVPSVEELKKLEFDVEKLKISNLVLVEEAYGQGALKDKNTLKFSATASNKSGRDRIRLVELAGFDKNGQLLFALNAGSLAPLKTETDATWDAKVWANPGVLKSLGKACVRVN
jgi:hypothetical protein